MSLFLSNLWFLLIEFLRVPVDAASGLKRRRYTLAFEVEAPKPVTWSVASAHNIRLEGTPPIEIAVSPDPDRAGVHRGHFKIGDRELPVAYRVIEERPGEAMLIALLKEESAPECCPGDDYVCAFAVAGEGQRSSLTTTLEITHTRLGSRFLMPLAAVQNSLRLKRNAELRAGTVRDDLATQVKNAALTGVLTFASFGAMFGMADAFMLIFLILIHELGHVIAMRWAGIPVKGIYFVPFFGGVAVGSGYKSEAERGLVALMGPGFSLLTTALFAFMAFQNNDETMRALALMSAILNGFNLLPIMPLDGGHIVYSLMSRTRPEISRAFQMAALLAGGALALFAQSIVLLAVLLLVAPSIANNRSGALSALPPLSSTQFAMLLVAYLATLAFYVFIAGGLVPQAPAEATVI